MKMIRLSILFVLISFASCQNSEDVNNTAVIENQDTVFFDINKVNNQFKQRSANEKLIYINSQIHTIYSNKDDFENWFLHAIKELNGAENFDEDIVIQMNEGLSRMGYLDASVAMAYWTQSKFRASNIKVHGASSVSLVNHYAFLKQRDSMEKYLDVLYRAIEIDSIPYQNLVYYTCKAHLEEMSGNFIESIILYSEALNYIDSTDLKNKSTINQDIALVYLNLGYYEKALDYVNDAITNIGKSNLNYSQLNNLAIIQGYNGLLDSAEMNFQYVLEKSYSDKSFSTMAMTYSNYANLKQKQGSYDEALEYYFKSDSICKAQGIEIGVLFNLINSAGLDILIGNYNIALSKLRKAEQMSYYYDLPKIKIELYERLSSAYSNLSDTNKSNFYFKKHILAKEEFFGDYPRAAITAWELNKENDRLSELNAKIENENINQRLKNYIITFILVLGLMISISLYLFLSRRQLIKINELKKKNKQVEQDLEMRSKELLTESIKEVALIETREALYEKLNHIVKTLPEIYKSKFHNLINELSSKKTKFLDSDFQTRFNFVYEDFFKKILEIAPDLTPNEIKICAYLKLNISTKEIAALTNKSIGTIDNARSSIRKKIKIDNNTNLQNFLIGI